MENAQEVVTRIILDKYNDLNLELNSRLLEDLGLNSVQVFELGLMIEKHYSDSGEFYLSDKVIMNWRTVQDMINSCPQ